MAGLRNSFGRTFQRTGEWRVNDLSVILSREETVGRLRVTVVDERTTSKCPIGYGEDCGGRRACEIGVFCRWLREFCSVCVDRFWANVKISEQVRCLDLSLNYHAPALWNSLPKDLHYPLSQTSSTHLSHTTNDQLLALSPSQFHCKLKTHLYLQSFPPLVYLHLFIVGSLVHSTWLYFHFTTLSLSLYHSYHLISSAIYGLLLFNSVWEIENKPPSSFHSGLVGFYRHSKSPHSSSLLFSHLISSYVNIFCHSHFILWGNCYRYRYQCFRGQVRKHN